MKSLILYGTKGCHLCDKAEAILKPFCGPRLTVQYRDIADDESLVDQLGEKIPVLESEDGRRLFWPFSPLDINRFLAT